MWWKWLESKFWRPHKQGLSTETRILLASCVLVLIALMGFIGASYLNSTKVLSLERNLDHSYQVLYELSKIRSALNALEASSLSYMLSRDERCLQRSVGADERLNKHLMRLNSIDPKLVTSSGLKEMIAESIWKLDHPGLFSAASSSAAELSSKHADKSPFIRECPSRLFIDRMAEQQETAIKNLLAKSHSEELIARNCFACLGVFLALVYTFVVIRMYLNSLEKQHQLRSLNDLSHDLATARDEALLASKLKSEFIANVSHELRTPLTGMIGAVELLKLSRNLDQEEQELLDTAHDCSKSLLLLLNEILDFSALEAQTLNLKESPFRLRESINSALAPSKRKAESKGLEFFTEIDPQIPNRLLGDIARVRQILLNLVENAIKFTERGSISVSVVLETLTNADLGLKFTIRDTGVGIEAESLKVIFQRFVQLDGSMTRSHGGVGLGLTITKNLVQLMKGKIDVESQPGKGSQFSVSLPFRLSENELPEERDEETQHLSFQPPEAKAIQQAPPPSQSPTSGSKPILVVDDSEVIRTVLIKQLRSLGFDVESARDGTEAIRKTKTNTYSLIFMDLQMPLLDGIGACMAIREDKNNASCRTPIVALTAHALPQDRQKCMKAGMDDYLSKPVSMNKLREILEDRICPSSRNELKSAS